MKSGIIAHLLLALATGCGAVEKSDLTEALNDSDPQVVCDTARQLGETGHVDSIPLLAKLTENELPEIRWCAVQSLSFYGDKGFCQDFYTIWLSDEDESVRQAAGMSLIAIDCDEENIERSAKFAMDAKSCGYTQFFINEVKKSVAEAPPGDSWPQLIKGLNIKETITDKNTPEEILQMRLNLAFSVIDWGESVAVIHDFSNYGSSAKNRLNHLPEIERYTFKEEYIKQFCPLIFFPEFSYWNDKVVGKKALQKTEE